MHAVDVAVLVGGEAVHDQAVLQRRQRQHLLHLGAGEQRGEFGLRQHVGQRRLHGLLAGRGAHRAQRGEAGDGAGPEQVADREADALTGGTHDDARGPQGRTADREEVVVDGDGVQAEHLGVQGAQPLFERGAGGAAVGAGDVHRRGQGAAVQLAVGGQRQCVQDHHGARHHVLGQRLGEMGAQQRRVALRRHDVRHEALVAGPVLAHQHGSPLDRRVREQRRLDVAEFDTEAAHLDLVVETGQEREGPVVLAPHQVTGAVQAPGTVRVGDEALGGQTGAAAVAAGHAVTGDVQLAAVAGRHRAQGRVEDVHPGVEDRRAERDGAPVDGRGHRPHGRLGRPVHVGDPRGVLGERPGEGLRQCLAAGEHADTGEDLGPRLDERLPQAGRGLHDGDALALDDGPQGVRVEHLVAAREHHAGTGEQRLEDLQYGDVEAHGGHREQPVAGADRHRAGHRGEEVVHRGPFQDHALGTAGGAGGVDDVRRGARVLDAAERARVTGGQVHLVEEQGGHPVRDLAAGDGDEQFGTRVVEDHRAAVGGVFGVDRQIGAAGLEHREQRDDEVRRARQGDADEPFGADAARGEQTGQPVGAGVQLGVGEGLLGAQGHGVGGRGGLLLEEFDEGAGDVPRGVVDSVQQLLRDGRGEEVGAPDGRVGGLGERAEQPQEPVLVGPQFVLGVQLRVGRELQQDPALGGIAVRGHRQVGHRAVGQLPRGGEDLAEPDAGVEGHGVDGRGEHGPVGAGQLTGLVQLLPAEALRPQQGAQFGAGRVHQLGEGGVGSDRQPQRHVVGEHGGGGERGRGAPGGHRDAEDHVVDREQPVVVDGGGRGDHGRPVAYGGERTGQLAGQLRPQPQSARRGSGGPVGEALPLLGPGEAPEEEVAVARVVRGLQVGALLRQQHVESPGPGRPGLLPGEQRGVDPGQPVQVAGLAEAVQDDVVVAQVEEVPPVREHEQRVPEQRARLQVRGGGHVLVHPGAGGGLRVGLAAQVHQVHRGVHVARDDLEDLPVVAEPGAQRFGLAHGARDGAAQHPDVEGTGVEVDGALVESTLRCQALRHPHAELGGGDGQPDIVANLGKCQPTHAPRTVFMYGPHGARHMTARRSDRRFPSRPISRL
ncbi:hypothetical protein GCM10018783_36850 [Streptomyces griseosporeus]|nr:hypothetical protein GCM10018783_36850 [Streptomyces griseosporeus]